MIDRSQIKRVISNPIISHDIPKAILLTGRDPFSSSIGGQAAFARNLLKAFGPDFAVTSHCEDKSIPVGKWIYRYYGHEHVLFLSRGRIQIMNNKKPIIPTRLSAFYSAQKFLPTIRKIRVQNVFIDSPELLLAAAFYPWHSVCFCFAGVNNPVLNSRYIWLRIFGGITEKLFMKVIRRTDPDVILASADNNAIDEFVNRTDNVIDRSKFFSFPTRVDTALFKPMSMYPVRQTLRLPLDQIIITSVGRLSWIKGWGFVPQKEVVKYINAANLGVVGSYREGWSLAMCEILACGKPIVSTDVSGARQLILNDLNGFVVNDRNPDSYANAILKALKLKNVECYSLKIANRYSVKTLGSDLGKLWMPLQS
jgi:glycosyltransferase involved in cell wall biosynthesis